MVLKSNAAMAEELKATLAKPKGRKPEKKLARKPSKSSTVRSLSSKPANEVPASDLEEVLQTPREVYFDLDK